MQEATKKTLVDSAKETVVNSKRIFYTSNINDIKKTQETVILISLTPKSSSYRSFETQQRKPKVQY